MYKYIYIYHISLGWKLHVVVHFCWGWHEAPRRGRQTQGGAPPWGWSCRNLEVSSVVFLRCKMDENGVPSLKINMEPFFLNTPLKEGDSFWKPSFSGSMLNFGGAPSLKLTYLRFSHLKMDGVEDDDCFPSFWSNLGLFSGALNEKLLGFYFRDEKAKGPTVDIQSYCWWFRNPAHILHHLIYA